MAYNSRVELGAAWDACAKCSFAAAHKVYGICTQLPADIALVGKHPGREELRKGRPLVGETGKLLQPLIQHAKHLNIYVTNALCCMPKAAVSVECLHKCFERLAAELYLSHTLYAVAMGETAFASLVSTKLSYERLLGTWVDSRPISGKYMDYSIQVFVTYNPARFLYGSKIIESKEYRNFTAHLVHVFGMLLDYKRIKNITNEVEL